MARDPYRYFRIEAQELVELLGQGLLGLEKGPDPQLVAQLLRQAHTLKGASRIVKEGDIGERAHRLEDLLSPHREGGGPLEKETIDEALGELEAIAARVARLGSGQEDGQEVGAASAASAAQAPQEGATGADGRAIRVAIRDLDLLLEGVFEAVAMASTLRRETRQLESLGDEATRLHSELAAKQVPQLSRVTRRAERLATELTAARGGLQDRVDRLLDELGELQALATELRLVPARTLVNDLELVVRDAARTLGKDVSLHAKGAETHVDAHVLAGLRQALVHLVRNAVAHGIESSSRRSQLGKPTTGRIDIGFERRGHRVMVSCSDDGMGLDLASVREVAARRGLVSSEEARSMDELDLGRLLLSGGVSTSPDVSAISGRGLGLAVVRHAVETLAGEISLFSREGEGTRLEMLVPITRSTVPGILATAGELGVFLPMDCVRRVVRFPRSERSSAGRLPVNGTTLPYRSLRRALERPADTGRPSRRSDTLLAVVLDADGRQMALGVEGLGGMRDVVVHALPFHAAIDPVVSGITFDERGVPQPVLSPTGLVQATSKPGPQPESEVATPLPPVLLVDDSLTTRMLEQSILETAGYDVDLAISGEDGLEQARRRHYGLFVVDVEMPGMDGFEFISAARADPELRDVPAILVTSRADAEDRRRGEELGARAYIVKSEFDQARLLETVRRLLR